MKLGSITKTIVALLGAVSTWGVTAAADGSITLAEAFAGLGAIATALGVYYFPNTQSGPLVGINAPEAMAKEAAPND